MSVPMRNADKVVPTIAKVKIVPKFRKKYFYKKFNWIVWKLDFFRLYPFQTVSGVENDWRQNDVEENLRIKCCLQINFVNVSNKLTTESVRICVVLRRCRVIECPWEMKPKTVGRQTLIVSCRLFSFHREVSRRCRLACEPNYCTNYQSWKKKKTISFPSEELRVESLNN